MIQVNAKSSVQYSLEPVVVERRFQALASDEYGLFCRMVDARQVK